MIFYKSIRNEVEVFKHAYANGLPLMIKGPTGCGKSRFVEKMAEEMRRPLISVACHDETSAGDLIGRYLVQGGDTVWQDGPVSRAVREGAILYLDEIAEAREDVVVVLHPLTDHRRHLFMERRNELLLAPKEFMLVVSYNPGYQKAFKEMKPSTRQRFIGLSFHYPASEVEIEIVQKEGNCEKNISVKLVQFGLKVRNLQELGLTETVSTRLLIGAAKLIRSGLPAREACDVAIVQALTDDLEIAEALNNLASLIF